MPPILFGGIMGIFPPSSVSRSSLGTKSRAGVVGVLDPPAKAVVMTAAGNISIKTLDGATVTFTGLPAGYVVPYVVQEIVSISSSAATIDG